MQFAGQRTDMDLQPIGEPINLLVKLTEEVLPDPGAILVTGITPQKTLQEGYTEAEFLKILHDEVLKPNTIIVGFNNVRFDDEFMRYSLYRNFYDPYEWAWAEGRSRWDLLDVIRMTRALRPEGIQWPFDAKGKATNRLELLSGQNGLDHENAHDALNDVQALIAVAQLIRSKQPKLFDYLFEHRSKQAISEVVSVDNPQPFVYASGRYHSETLHATVAYPLAPSDKNGSVIVWDLRHDPTEWVDKSVDELKSICFANREQREMEGFVALPAKELNMSRCPAVAPLGVLTDEAQQRIKLDLTTIEMHLKNLRAHRVLADKLCEVFAPGNWPKQADVDARLYDGFLNEKDKNALRVVRAADANTLADFHPDFSDDRLGDLLLRYKARNFPTSLSEGERAAWEMYRTERLQRDAETFTKALMRMAQIKTDDQSQFILQELQLWAESIMPSDE